MIDADEALADCCRRHGLRWVAQALRDAAKSQLRDINLSNATEERIAERAAPWEQTCAELAAVCE